MAYADLVAPEETLADMLVECQTWRAIVANPSATWAELVVILDAGTVSEGDAASRVDFGAFQEQWDEPGFLERPRAGIRQLEDDNWQRTSSSGFSLTGSLYLLIELQIPPSLKTDMGAALLDARRKSKAIESDLLNLMRQNGRLDITAFVVQPAGLSDPKEHTEETQFQILEYGLAYEGAN